MATEEDNFDIDIYGDGAEEYTQDTNGAGSNAQNSQPVGINVDGPANGPTQQRPGSRAKPVDDGQQVQSITSTDQPATAAATLPKHAPQEQGNRTLEEEDQRPLDPGATSALSISELDWWITDDDVRGWANQSQCEYELEDVSFSEHKVNGKSKGQVYLLFKSAQAATAVKQQIEKLGESQPSFKRFAIRYTNPNANPFRILPKDGSMRGGAQMSSGRGSPNSMQGFGVNSYRGGRGSGFGGRGGPISQGPNTGRGGFQPQMNGYQSGNAGGFQGMGGMQPYGGFQGRGGMTNNMRGGNMNMRGGRGSMLGMPMGMGMGAMAMGMGMGMPQMGGMNFSGAGFQGNQGGFTSFFNNQANASQGYGGTEGAHPSKRTRQD